LTINPLFVLGKGGQMALWPSTRSHARPHAQTHPPTHTHTHITHTHTETSTYNHSRTRNHAHTHTHAPITHHTHTHPSHITHAHARTHTHIFTHKQTRMRNHTHRVIVVVVVHRTFDQFLWQGRGGEGARPGRRLDSWLTIPQIPRGGGAMNAPIPRVASYLFPGPKD